MNAAKRHAIYARLQAANPHPTTELNYSTPFELLVAVVLSAQATDVGVNKVTRRLYPRANTPQAMLALSLPELRKAISTLGLYNAKAANVFQTCRLLIERHGGEVPRVRAELEALPGLIDQLETEQRSIADLLADGSLFSTDRARATALSERSAAIEDELMKALERWEELGSR